MVYFLYHIHWHGPVTSGLLHLTVSTMLIIGNSGQHFLNSRASTGSWRVPVINGKRGMLLMMESITSFAHVDTVLHTLIPFCTR